MTDEKRDNPLRPNARALSVGNASAVQRIRRNAAGQLELDLHGRDEPVVDVKVVRCFPWTVPERYISLRGPEDKEVVMLRSLDDLDDKSRRVVEEELQDKVFNPKIQRILSFKDEFGVTQIEAETDRGRVTFQIRSRDDIRVLSHRRALFRDVDGNTYELSDLSALDAAGRKYLERYF
jgi:hypothetical protein